MGLSQVRPWVYSKLLFVYRVYSYVRSVLSLFLVLTLTHRHSSQSYNTVRGRRRTGSNKTLEWKIYLGGKTGKIIRATLIGGLFPDNFHVFCRNFFSLPDFPVFFPNSNKLCEI